MELWRISRFLPSSSRGSELSYFAVWKLLSARGFPLPFTLPSTVHVNLKLHVQGRESHHPDVQAQLKQRPSVFPIPVGPVTTAIEAKLSWIPCIA